MELLSVIGGALLAIILWREIEETRIGVAVGWTLTVGIIIGPLLLAWWLVIWRLTR